MDADRTPPQEGRQPGWGVVAFQTSMIAALLVGAVIVAASAHAASSTIGRTWPIAEPDALAEIEARASKLPANMRAKFGPRSGWSAMKAASLTPATKSQTRSVVPFYTLDTEIRLPGGELLYPKGYSFNPLTYVTLPQRLVVVHPRDLAWALKTARLTDFILLAAGDAKDDDAITLSERTGRPIFILEERIKDRLGLTVAPAIIAQVGQKLELTEVRLVRTGQTQSTPPIPRKSAP
ncbi:conjugal transfer protein TraW [Sphingobium fluviale]|jgi:conjugal transfer pilus assembly protein TraW